MNAACSNGNRNKHFLFAYRNEARWLLYSTSLESNWKDKTQISYIKMSYIKLPKLSLDHIQNKMANLPMKKVN